MRYLTREDKIDLEKLNWQMMTIEEKVYKEGRNYHVQLDKEQDDLRWKLDKAIEQVGAENREELRKQENNRNNDLSVTNLPHSRRLVIKK